MKNELESLADDFARIADSCRRIAEGVGEPTTSKFTGPAKITTALPTIDDIRAVLAQKSIEGKTTAIRDLLGKYNADKLSSVKPEDYARLKAEAEKL